MNLFRYACACGIFLVASVSVHAQLSLEPVGARSAGVGNITTVLADVWAAVGNPAGLGMLSGVHAGVSHEQRFMMAETGVSSLAGVFPLLGNGVGLSLSNLGFANYGENRFGLAVGRKLSPLLAVGVGVDGHLMRFPEDYKNLFAVNGNAGVWARPAKNLTLGFHVFNLTFSQWNNREKTSLPVVFSLGAGYSPAAPVLLLAEISKNVCEPARIKAGTEFLAGKALYLRAGIITRPFEVHFGVGCGYGHFRFDAALSRHPVLGCTPQAAITLSP
jgi:hypothetical protein